MRTTAFLALLAMLSAPLAAHHRRRAESEETSRRGYVLQPGEGEKLGPGRIIKASPESGTQGSVMVLDQLRPGFSTGIHVHTEADEFFYVVSGRGTATMGADSIAIGPGAVVFVPAGSDHAMSVDADSPMELLFFLDRPGLEEFFREAHARYFSQSKPFTLEACNAVGAPHGMFCKTLGNR